MDMLKIMGYLFGCMFIITGLGSIFINFILGITFILMGSIICPPIYQSISKKINLKLKVEERVIAAIAILIIGAIVGAISLPSSNPNQELGKLSNTQEGLLQSGPETIQKETLSTQTNESKIVYAITDIIAQCESLAKVDERDSCFSAAAMKYKEYVLCDKVLSNTKKIECEEWKATEYLDIKLCKTNSCKIAIAIKTKKAEYCPYGPLDVFSMTACILPIVKETKDTVICYKMTTKDDQAQCLSAAGDCYNIKTEEERDKCLVTIAKTIQDCYKVGDIYTTLSSSGFIPGTPDYELSDWEVQGKRESEPGTYTENTILMSNQEYCMGREIFESKNENDCKEIEKYKETCYSVLALTTNNIDYCNNISTDSFKDKCIRRIAIKYKNPKLCDILMEQNLKYECYSHAEK